MADAPRLAGAEKLTVSEAFAVVMELMVGAVGYGLTIESSEAVNVLALTSLTVATRNRIVSPGVKPVIEAEVEVETPSLTHTHVVPASREYCST